MANINNKSEPSTAPQPDRWYNLTLGSSFKDDQPSSKFCTLRYEFKPASIDKNQPGTLNKTKDNKVTVEFHSNIPGKPKTAFEGTSSDDYKENDAVLLFNGESFRLERLHRAVKRLKRVWQPGESASAATPATSGGGGGGGGASSVWAGGASESGSPPVEKGSKFQSFNRNGIPAVPVEVERIEIGDFKSSAKKLKNEKVVEEQLLQENASNASPYKMDELEEELDILNDDNDAAFNEGNNEIKEFDTGIDINIPQQNDSDDEIAVDASDDEADKGRNAAEALRAQVNAQEKEQQTSSSSDSSGSESSGSGSGSGSASGSGSSSSDSESSDGDTVNSV